MSLKSSYLNGYCNGEETYRDFIRNSEKDLGIEKSNLRNMSLKEIQKYVDWLDEMWLK
jgi:hypothetical protein